MPDPVYDARGIANYLIQAAAPRGGLDALQVMKLTYIAHGFALGLFNRLLIDDDVEAWKLGPVVRKIYDRLPGGSAPIITPISQDMADVVGDDKALVDGVLNKYGRYTGLYLSSLTHRPGSPWEKTWSKYGQNAVIPREIIQTHYQGIIAAMRAATAEKPYHPSVL